MFQPPRFRCLVFCLILTFWPASARAVGTEPQTPLPKGAVGRLACREREYFGWVAFSDDGKLAATSHPRSLRLWEVATGKQQWRVPCAVGGALIFSRDGKVLVKVDLDGINTYDVGTGKKLRRIAPPVKGLERFVVYH